MEVQSLTFFLHLSEIRRLLPQKLVQNFRCHHWCKLPSTSTGVATVTKGARCRNQVNSTFLFIDSLYRSPELTDRGSLSTLYLTEQLFQVGALSNKLLLIPASQKNMNLSPSLLSTWPINVNDLRSLSLSVCKRESLIIKGIVQNTVRCTIKVYL